MMENFTISKLKNEFIFWKKIIICFVNVKKLTVGYSKFCSTNGIFLISLKVLSYKPSHLHPTKLLCFHLQLLEAKLFLSIHINQIVTLHNKVQTTMSI